MSKKKDSHKSRLEATFGVSENNKEDLFDLEEREQFGSSFTTKKKPKDPQYEKLIREFKVKNSEKAIDFEKSSKYAGKKVGKEELLNENLEKLNLNEENIKKTKKKPKLKLKTKETKESKEKVDEYLKEIEQEDIQDEVHQVENDANSLEKAKTVKYQLNLWKVLLSFRLQLQPLLELIKKYPKTPIKSNTNLENQLLLAFLLENLSKIQQSLLNSSSHELKDKILPDFYSIISPQITSSEPFLIDSEAIYTEIDGLFSNFFPWAEKNLTKWSEKTQILSSNLSKTGLKNLLHTPIGQVNKMMENFEKLQQKSQLKRGTFRILFEGLENLEQDYNEDIYDDNDLLQELMRSSLEQKNEQNGNDEENSLFETTRQYLFERKLKNEEKRTKDVDRRASKNRKLRYDVHAKLINFMQSDERGVGEGREEIVNAIKRRFEKGIDEVEDGKVRKKTKGNGKYEPRLI